MSETNSGNVENAAVATRETEAVELWSNRRILFLALAIALIAYAVFRLPTVLNIVLARAREIVILLILSTALTFFLLPAVEALCKIKVNLRPKIKRSVAAIIAIVLFLALLVGLATVTVAPIVEETGQVIQTVTNWARGDFAVKVQSFTDDLIERLPEQYRGPIREQVAAAEQELTVERLAETISQRVEDWGGTLLQWQVSILATILSSGRYLVGLVMIPVFAYYFLTDATAIRNATAARVPEEARPRYNQMLTDMDMVIHRYVRAIMIISLITGVATAVTLYFAGVDVFLTFGLLAGIANMVPVLGAIVAVISISIISLLQVGLKTTIIVMIVYGGIQLVTDRVISPKLMADGAELHPIVVLVGLLVGAEFFGMIGVFVAVPVLAAARVGLLHYRAYVTEGEASKEFDRLLGRERPPCKKQEAGGDENDHAEPQSVVDDDASDDAPDGDAADDEAVNGEDVTDEHD